MAGESCESRGKGALEVKGERVRGWWKQRHGTGGMRGVLGLSFGCSPSEQQDAGPNPCPSP